MHYEINVSQDGKHLFATHERSIQDRTTLRNVYREIAQRFPASEGFRVTVTRWETVGHGMSEHEIYK